MKSFPFSLQVSALVLVGFLAGAGVGYLAGSHKAPTPATANVGAAPVKKTSVRNLTAESSEAPTEDYMEQPLATRPMTTAEFLVAVTEMESRGFGGMDNMRKWAELTERIRAGNPAEFAKALASAPLKPGMESAWHMVITAYADKDPQGAWTFAQGLPAGQSRMTALHAAASGLAQKDITLALSQIDQLSDPSMKRQLRSIAMMNLAGKDPRKAYEIFQNSKRGNDENYLVNTIFYQWARKDLEGAKSAVSGLTGPSADMARSALVNVMAQSDPRAAWEYAKSLPGGNGRGYQDPRLQVIQTWAQTDPSSALQAALQIQEAGIRASTITSAVSAWARNDFDSALQYSVSIQDPTLRSDTLRAISNNGESANPEALLQAVLEHMPPGDNFQQAVSGILSNWSRTDPKAAASAVTQLPPGRIFSQAVSNVASQWSRTGPVQDALAWVKTLPEGEARQGAMRSVFSDWSQQDPASAIAALQGLNSEDKKRAIRAVASGWSRQSPEAVLEWSSRLPDGDERNDVIRDAVGQWAGSAPEAAARFVKALPEKDRNSAVQAVVNQWASKDVESASEWVSALPDNPAKDSAVTTLARKMSAEDPEIALSWLDMIANQETRTRETESLAKDWLRQDPKAAKSWISSSNLPPDVQARLLK